MSTSRVSMASRVSTKDRHGAGSGSSSTPQMEGSSSEDRASKRRERETKLNSSVYELYMPPNSDADVDILFFHGLHTRSNKDAYLSTWRSRNERNSLWPKEWLPEEYPNARVLTISYDGDLNKYDEGGRMDLHLVAESLLADLWLASVGQTRPVILVGHSFGGLIIKKLCVIALSKKSMQPGEETTKMGLAFLNNLRGIFYYATPHQGSEFTDRVKFDGMEGELVGIVKVLNSELTRLNQDFQSVQQQFKWHIVSVIETRPTDLEGVTPHVIVREASARTENTIAVSEDHFSICQPRQKSCSTYKHLVSFIGEALSKMLSTVKSKFEDLEGDLQIMPPTPVGVLESWEGGEIGQMLESNSALGIWGMGGIGKTTLAKAIFNRKRSNFEFTLFVEEVKSMPGTNRSEFVEKLLERVHQRGKQVEKRSGKSILKGKDLLMVLDDVDCKDDQDDRDIRLVHELRDFCSPNSRFILTSRNSGILNRVGRINIVKLRSLDDTSSERLLRSYALPYSNDCVSLPEWQQRCLLSIVKHCGGLPLILEVVGQYLKNSGERAVWKETSRALVKADKINGVGVDVVRSKLKVSYDGLGEEEKNMFIDAATFFQDRIPVECGLVWYPEQRTAWHRERWTLREAKAAWGVTYGTEERRWKTLVDRSLVSDVAEDSPIKLHEHLLHFGQWLATNEGKRIQIRFVDWRFNRLTSSKVLRIQKHQPQEIHTIQVLVEADYTISRFFWRTACLTCRLKTRVPGCGWNLDSCPHSIPRIHIMDLHRMKNLQYLQLELGVSSRRKMRISFGEKKVSLPPNLVILRCVNVGKNVSFATCTKLVNLFMLHFRHELPSSLCSLKNLQDLELQASDLKCLPDRFGNLVNLRHLTLSKCSALERFPDSFGRMRSLQTLKALYCSKLVVSSVFLGDLQSLQVLEIFSCRRLVEGSFGGLRSLRVLKINSCRSLVRLCDSFGGLRSLQTLEIIGCEKLVELPDSLGDLESLQVLKIRYCGSLVLLPDSVGRLKSLQTLEIRFCKGLVGLPDSFGGLQNLQELELWGCERMERFPDSFGGLQNLQKLTLFEWKRMKRLPDYFGGLQNLKKLTLILCTSMESLPHSIYSLKNLQLEVKDCGRLVDFP